MRRSFLFVSSLWLHIMYARPPEKRRWNIILKSQFDFLSCFLGWYQSNADTFASTNPCAPNWVSPKWNDTQWMSRTNQMFMPMQCPHPIGVTETLNKFALVKTFQRVNCQENWMNIGVNDRTCAHWAPVHVRIYVQIFLDDWEGKIRLDVWSPRVLYNINRESLRLMSAIVNMWMVVVARDSCKVENKVNVNVLLMSHETFFDKSQVESWKRNSVALELSWRLCFVWTE